MGKQVLINKPTMAEYQTCKQWDKGVMGTVNTKSSNKDRINCPLWGYGICRKLWYKSVTNMNVWEVATGLSKS